jgi:hypothetical protein
MKTKVFGLIAICAIAATSVGGSASAATVFTANLTGNQEVPPNSSSAFGFGTFILNDAMTALTYNITVFGIDVTGSQTANPNDNLSAALFMHRVPRVSSLQSCLVSLARHLTTIIQMTLRKPPLPLA